MPSFGGFNLGTGGLVNGLLTNAVGSVANAIFPQSAFGGFGLTTNSLIGQKGTQDATNRRVSLRPKPGAVSRVIGNGILKPLTETTVAGGLNVGQSATGTPALVFPYTPTIQYSPSIDYQSLSTVHSNQDYHIYSKTPAVPLTVDGTFTVQNQKEGLYAFAAIHFLRTMSKMNFGENDPNAGTPPPILLFNAYGPFVFNNLPVIVNSFSVSFPDDVDYVQVNVPVDNSTMGKGPLVNIPALGGVPGSGIIAQNLPPIGKVNPLNFNTVGPAGGASGTTYDVWLPSMFKINVSMIVQHTPSTMQTKFNLPKFINGDSSQASFI